MLIDRPPAEPGALLGVTYEADKALRVAEVGHDPAGARLGRICDRRYSFSGTVLRAAGWALVVNNEPVAPADIIVLTIDSGGAGVPEAADLVQNGVSKRESRFLKPAEQRRL